jgi:hypothetical protein
MSHARDGFKIPVVTDLNHPEKKDGVHQRTEQQCRHKPYCPACKPPDMRYHLLKNPQVGGTPMMLKAPVTKQAMVTGIFKRAL